MLLEIRDLSISVQSGPREIQVVDRVNLNVPRGKVVALVGESGCGKSLTAFSILRLLPKPLVRITEGRIKFKVQSSIFKDRGVEALEENDQVVDLARLSDRQMRSIRGREIAMIFQEPMTALNPVFSIGEQIVEALTLHRKMNQKEAWAVAADLLVQVGIHEPQRRVRDYPHQFSGGMRQRVLIAMALACRPQLLIADEPTTALDVTVQAQILELLRGLQGQTGMSILLITHDLGVVAQMADFVYVMYAGRIVEQAAMKDLFARPMHPYTQGLFACTPTLDNAAERLEAIPGSVPTPGNHPSGCRFHPRCTRAAVAADAHRSFIETASGLKVLRRCVESYDGEPSGPPVLREVAPDHFVACWEANPPLALGEGRGEG